MRDPDITTMAVVLAVLEDFEDPIACVRALEDAAIPDDSIARYLKRAHALARNFRAMRELRLRLAREGRFA